MTTKLVDRIQQIIISANRYAWDHYEIGLDLTENSITKLDSVIQIEKLKAKENDQTNFDITKSSRVWGVYLGEIVRNKAGGTWLFEDGDLILQVSGVNLFPLQHVNRILCEQSNLTAYSYYKDFCMKIGCEQKNRGDIEKVSELIDHQIIKAQTQDIYVRESDDNEFEKIIKEISSSPDHKPGNQDIEYEVIPEDEKKSFDTLNPPETENDRLVVYRVWLAVIGIGIVIGTSLPWFTVKKGYTVTEVYNGYITVPGLVTFLLGAVAIFSSIYSKTKKPDWIVSVSSLSVFVIPIFTWLVKDIWYHQSCFEEFFGDPDAVCAVTNLGTGFNFSTFFIVVLFIFTQVTRKRRNNNTATDKSITENLKRNSSQIIAIILTVIIFSIMLYSFFASYK